MSDKSFGDHTNRNIVKNPLLSSAVTGLSLEDLTHKAVLLPVSPSLDQISRSDQQQGSQACTLAYPRHDTAVFPSGDALSNPVSTPQTTNLNVLDSKNNVKLEENRNTQNLATSTVSKASAKSEDDFDVNEYIARLQGTRYVSAPLHSHLKEDQNANLDATEENLEEINLNETAPTEVQQSLTADIAQNFSQLPTVLPHVASAVFSSFSNMLNYKTREVTPDRANVLEKKSGYDEVQFHRPADVGVPLMGVEESKVPKEVAPPPKELPIGGASNFRITTKKKYAQIPGLSSGDAAQTLTFMPGQSLPPMGQNMLPTGQYMPTMGQNMPPMGQNMPLMGQNMPPMGQNMPLMGHNMPPMGQNMPTMSQNMPPMGQNMSLMDQNMPPMGQNMPPMGQNMPPMCQNMPPMGQNRSLAQNVPLTDENLPPIGHNMAHISQSIPEMSQNISSMSQNRPSHVPPTSQNVPAQSQSVSNLGQSSLSAHNILPPTSHIPLGSQNIPEMEQSILSMDQSTNMAQMPPTSQSIPPFQPPHILQEPSGQNVPFTPSAQTAPNVSQSTSNIGENATPAEQSKHFVQIMPSVDQTVSVFDPNKFKDTSANDDVINSQVNQAVSQVQYNILNPAVANPTESKPLASDMQPNLYGNQSSNFFAPVEKKEQNVAPASIIPPPPMFSNTARRDSQSSAGKSILPPSVARRISANQPIIKPTTSTPSFMENIFVPAPVSSETTQADNSFSSPSSAFVPAFGSSMKLESSHIVPTPTQTNVPSNASSSTPASYFTPTFDSSSSSTQNIPTPTSNLTSLPPSSFAPMSTNMPTSPPSKSVLGSTQSNIPPTLPSIPPTSVFTPEVSPQNAPPTMFQPAQNVPFFNPQEPSTNAPPPITQMPPSAVEPPKPVPEPPKATGAVNYRMTKKRPQYYAGPIEGIGAISNNVKPVLAPAMPTPPEGANFQGALFTPDQLAPAAVPPAAYAAPDLDQALVPFDISKPVEPVTSYDISKTQDQGYGTSFNMGQPESYNYQQEYNTPFDTSRDPNDPYNEPKQESIGFGIIGSLKSKLSSIDINKIQNTVTTFFDPAYNDTKVADPVPQNNPPYQHQQYGQSQEGQSNFDIFVPSVEHNQYSQYKPIGFDYSHGPEYYQTQDPYMQSQSQDLTSYSTSSYFTDPNFSTEQVYSSNPLYDNTQSNYSSSSYNPQGNIPENVNKLNTESSTGNTTFYNPNAFTQDNLAKRVEQYETSTQKDKDQSNNVQINQQNVKYFDPNLPTNTTHFPTSAQPKQKYQENITPDSSNMTYYNPNAYESRQIWEPQQVQDNNASFTQSFEDNQKNLAPATKEENQAPKFYNPNAFSVETQQESPITVESNVQESSRKESDVMANISKVAQDVQSDYQSTGDSALNTMKYNISNIHTHSVPPKVLHKVPPASSFFDSAVATSQHFEPQYIEQATQSMPDYRYTAFAEQKEPITEILPTVPCVDDKKIETERINETNLIESISKQNIPVVGVSTVPLFGLSTIIADKSKEMFETDADNTKPMFESKLQTKNYFEENIASSLFDSAKPDNKIISENQAKSSPLGLSLSINDVKNVLLIEPPQENIGALLKKNASISKLENLSTERTSAEHKQIEDKSSITYQESETPVYIKRIDDIASQQTDTTNVTGIELDDNTELNICETCREVDTPEHDQKHEKTEDLTTQLIENITARMPLSHPLTVPLPEGNIFPNTIPYYDQQLDEINQVAEETFETLRMQAATELLGEPVRTCSEIRDYGWVTQEIVEPKAPLIDHDYSNKHGPVSTVHDCGPTLEPAPTSDIGMDYEFKLDPNNIGFFGNATLFSDNVAVPNNASDEIKAEIKHSHEDIVLPRQMSIPTAPPEEDIEPKLDEPGVLDVHSIEQDAKKDFPLEEELIIEPSTDEFLSTDDDKIELRERKRSSEDSSNDTFTHRIERFNKKVDNDSSEQSDETPYTSPPISMASYFDTGNYAVESHYRNTFISMRIPPGFEEEFAKKLSDVSLGSDKTPEPYVPETSTQTKTSNTCTYMSANDGKENIIGAEIKRKENIEAFAQAYAESKAQQNIETPQDSVDKKLVSLFDDKHSEQPEIYSSFSDSKALESEPKQATKNPIIKAIPPVSAFDETKPIQPEERFTPNVPIQAFHNPASSINVQSLPDPMNFFSANEEETKPIEPAAAESFSRLASYFSMPPPQPDHSKSFFELSQSQNHYRHDLKTENVQTFFETSKNRHIDDDTKNKVKELMKDLTSPRNIQTNVRTVNYFTVELDQDVSKHTTNANPINVKVFDEKLGVNKQNNIEKKVEIKDCKSKDKLEDKTTVNNNLNKDDTKTETDNIPNDDADLVKHCKYCVRHIPGVDSKQFIVRSAANDKTETKNDSAMSNQEKRSDGKKTAVNFATNYDVEKQAEDNVLVVNEHRAESEYQPVKHHWFYRVDVDDVSVWRGFSALDSAALEDAYHSPDLNENTLVATDGGRYDVNIVGRLRIAVYWKQKPTNVRRCSWFYKGTTDARYVPYTEAVAEKLEDEYRHGITTGEWHRKLVLPNSEMVIMHGPTVMVHFLHSGAADAFTTPPSLLGKRVYRNPLKIRVARDQKKKIDHLILLVHGAGEFKRKLQLDLGLAQATARPRVVRRSHEESEIEESEPSRIDHLLLLCHGVGSACDMRFRSVEEVVEDFRTTSLQLLQSHYRNSYDNGIVSRVEVLPISWHEQLHSGETGVDKRLSCVTLDSIPRLRAFTNHTVLDVLFYTSPVFHQTIIDTVCYELNRVYKMFCARNPNFKGEVSLGGHSLGSVILYDLLCHQIPQSPSNQTKFSAQKSYVSETAASGQLSANYPQLIFPPATLYALGSPIAIFECIRGVQSLGREFALPTCRNFFNIFHPYDPIAYRIEPLIDPQLQDVKPSQIPHHKGRKRMHLELKDTMARVGADLKQKLLESLRTTWNKWKSSPPSDAQLEKVVEEEMEKEQLCEDNEPISEVQATPEMLGRLNGGRRVDYVLQEAPLEMINEYLFAMSSHVGYWESEDTMLLMLREIYTSMGVQPDCTVPQQNMTVQRTKIIAQDDSSVVHETSEIPSTSRGGT